MMTLHYIPLVAAAVLSTSAAQAAPLSCGSWHPATSKEFGGKITVDVTEDALNWSNGWKNFTAARISATETRQIFEDKVSLYVVYGDPNAGSPIQLMRLFYDRDETRTARLSCSGKPAP